MDSKWVGFKPEVCLLSLKLILVDEKVLTFRIALHNILITRILELLSKTKHDHKLE